MGEDREKRLGRYKSVLPPIICGVARAQSHDILALALLRIANRKLLWKHEVVWFADGEYDPKVFSADVTYFRQHKFPIPSEYVVSSEPFDTLFIELEAEVNELFAKLSKTSRNEVRRSEKEEIEVCNEHEPQAIHDFVQHHGDFNSKKQLGDSISNEQLSEYEGQWLLYTAHRRGKWLGHLLLLHDRRRVRQWVLVNNLDFADRALLGYASKALVWFSIRDAKSRGFAVYDFGGIVLDEDDLRFGVTRFKMSFGGSPRQEQNSLVIPNPYYRALYQAVKGRRSR